MSDEIRYLFIDGGYLRNLYNDRMVPFLGEHSGLWFTAVKDRLGAKKAFYYDCQGKDESKSDFQKRVSEIQSLEGFHVRLGTLTGQRPRQKQVDVLLAVDMLTHAFHRNMSAAKLLAGDLDFKPVVESLVQLGTYVSVFSDSRSGSKELAWAADAQETITLEMLWGWSTAFYQEGSAHLFPRVNHNASPPRDPPLRQGSINERPLSLHQSGDDFMIYLHPHQGQNAPYQQQSVSCTFKDRDKLERYIRSDFGEIEWV